MASVSVYCRFRPLNEKESAMASDKSQLLFDFIGFNLVKDRKTGKDFVFDYVFQMNTAQDDLYQKAADPLLKQVMNGYNGTLLAYGQTGAGKTYTMEGESADPLKKGIIPRLVHDMGNQVFVNQSDTSYNITVQMIQIYKEAIDDLIETKNVNLKIHEIRNEGFFVKDLTEVPISKPEEILETFTKGTNNRATAATNMNKVSSRSHSIFIINIRQVERKSSAVKKSRLVLCDLAGSERISKTGAAGERLEEAKAINKSLSALGNVINALTEKGKSGHIPYRDSKLTFLLMNSLGGNSMTSLLIACSPAAFNYDETVSTLRFGIRAKEIKNKVKLNVTRSAEELQRLLDLAKIEINRLKSIIEYYKRGEKPPDDLFKMARNELTEILDADDSATLDNYGESVISKIVGQIAVDDSKSKNHSSLTRDEQPVFSNDRTKSMLEIATSGVQIGTTSRMGSQQGGGGSSEDINLLKKIRDYLIQELGVVSEELQSSDSQKRQLIIESQKMKNDYYNAIKELEVYKSTEISRENILLRGDNKQLRTENEQMRIFLREKSEEIELRKNSQVDNEKEVELRKAITSLKDRYKVLQEEHEIVLAERDVLSAELLKGQHQLADDGDYESDNKQFIYQEEVRKARAQFEKDKSALQSQTDQLMKQIQVLQNEKREKELVIVQINGKNDRTVAALQNELDRWKSAYNELNEMAGLTQQKKIHFFNQKLLDDTTAELKKLRKEYEELNENYLTLSSAHRQLNTKHNEFMELFGDVKIKNSTMSNNQVSILSKQLADKSTELLALKSQLEAANSNYAQSKVHCDGLLQQKRELEEANIQLREQLSLSSRPIKQSLKNSVRGSSGNLEKQKTYNNSYLNNVENSTLLDSSTRQELTSSTYSIGGSKAPKYSIANFSQEGTFHKIISKGKMSMNRTKDTVLVKEGGTCSIALDAFIELDKQWKITFKFTKLNGKVPMIGYICYPYDDISATSSCFSGVNFDDRSFYVKGATKQNKIATLELGSNIDFTYDMSKRCVSINYLGITYELENGLESPIIPVVTVDDGGMWQLSVSNIIRD